MSVEPGHALLGAVEGGGSKFLCAVGRGPRDIVDECRIATTTPDETLAKVAAFFSPYRARLTAVGVACFGPLELDEASPHFGSLLRTPKAGWDNAPVYASLRALLLRSHAQGRASTSLPIALDTDVNAAALAEQRWGAGRGADPVAYVTIGTGVGVGVVIGKEPLHGLMHPELGHLKAYDPDFVGSCPFHGSCVEGLISAPALRKRAGGEPSTLPDEHPLWDAVGRTLGTLLSTIVLAYAPQRIVVGGGVMSREGLLARAQRALVEELAGYVPRGELTWPAVQSYVVAPQLGALSGLAGGFALAERALRREGAG